jgi:hypothetical protein
MIARRWLYVALLIGSLFGLSFVQTRFVKNRHNRNRYRSSQHASLAQGVEPWRNGTPSHWRACLLQHGTGLLSRTESIRIP